MSSERCVKEESERTFNAYACLSIVGKTGRVLPFLDLLLVYSWPAEALESSLPRCWLLVRSVQEPSSARRQTPYIGDPKLGSLGGRTNNKMGFSTKKMEPKNMHLKVFWKNLMLGSIGSLALSHLPSKFHS
jgi:hypothetical protein